MPEISWGPKVRPARVIVALTIVLALALLVTL